MTSSRKLGVTEHEAQSAQASAEFAARWAAARWVYPIYVTLAMQCDLGLPPHTDLEGLPESPQPEMFARVTNWLEAVDRKIQPHQLRQLLQSSENSDEESLRALVLRHLKKEARSAADRDKLDFLLVQYFALCAPDWMYVQEITPADVARVLKPLLGPVEEFPPTWFGPLQEILQGLRQCQSLRDLLDRGILAAGRHLKDSAGEWFYQAGALVAFTCFNFILRRAFFRLLQADLRAIREAVEKLGGRGISSVDCRRAGLAAEETLESLLQICQDWRRPFSAAYSAGRPFQQIAALRTILEETLSGSGPAPAAETPASVSNTAPAGDTAAPAASPAPASPSPALAELQDAIDSIWEQLIATPPVRGRSMTSVVLKDVKVLVSPWEVAAFVREGGSVSDDLRRAVAARALLACVLECPDRSAHSAARSEALALARAEATNLQEHAARAKSGRNTEAAVNLGITAKRLLSFIEKAEGQENSNP